MSNVVRIRDVVIPNTPGDQIRAAVFSHDGKYLGVLLKDRPGRIYNLHKSLAPIALDVHESSTGLAFRTPNASHKTVEVAITSGARSPSIYRKEIDYGYALGVTPVERAHCVAYDEIGRKMACGTTDGWVYVWNMDCRPKLESFWKVGEQCVTALAFNAVGNRLYVMFVDGSCLRVDPADYNAPVLPVMDSQSPVELYCLAGHTSKNIMAFAGRDSCVYVLSQKKSPDGGLAEHVFPIDTTVGGYVRAVQLLKSATGLAVVGANTVEVFAWEDIDSQIQKVVSQTYPANQRPLAVRQAGSDLLVAVAQQ